ncbi:MAG: hypothetical protein HKN29_14575 [Rhodothermales bacterium]|nr:hypothetical protein [Rhodothermales bacterium]
MRVLVAVPTSSSALAVPSDCLVFEGDQPSVFVQRGAGRFELVPVVVEGVTDSEAFISSGILEGDEVAISEVFSLKALLRYGEYAED